MPKKIPFITWPHQEKAVKEALEVLGHADIGVEKARGEGATWFWLMLALHQWRFGDMVSIGLVSRDMDAADNADDPDSLFWKIDWQLRMLPSWLMGVSEIDYQRLTSKHTLKRFDNDSSIVAYAATGDLASGGRKDWFLMDELSKFARNEDYAAVTSTQAVTNCRVFVATPLGRVGAYYDMMHADSNMKKIVLDWRDNPTRNKGLYRMVAGRPPAVEPAHNPLPDQWAYPDGRVLDYQNFSEEAQKLFGRLRNKGFVLESGTRSPWLDWECDRPGATPQTIAQEFERDYGGSVEPVFSNEFHAMVASTVQPPVLTGNFIYTVADELSRWKYSFGEANGGRMRLWTTLSDRCRPPMGEYTVTADISGGGGGSHTSNSAATNLDSDGEHVAGYSTNQIVPNDFAEYCIALCLWYHGALLGWEINNFGAAFTRQVQRRGYSRVYMRTHFHKGTIEVKSEEIGWHTNEKSRPVLFQDIETDVRDGAVIVRDSELAAEFGHYIRNDAGEIVHSAHKTQSSKAGKGGKSHGDRVFAFGVGVQCVRELPKPVPHDPADWSNVADITPPRGSAAERLQPYLQEAFGRGRSDEDYPALSIYDRMYGVDLEGRFEREESYR